ncbi:hypothetical protein [Mycoplasmopsis alligatoris]|uniref:Lipoprotein n=1 Tax=Mycoplasmopsis alligatoris A21JP2 TaxID=747682 RepID=D4XW72_9BACT|nr:hypothetical protein [Mycoplasmopsis alligatoris]EFF41411.1 hypothetical protein MALL_0705 [Mycoplasmopsis alligatoris A21JP2]
MKNKLNIKKKLITILCSMGALSVLTTLSCTSNLVKNTDTNNQIDKINSPDKENENNNPNNSTIDKDDKPEEVVNKIIAEEKLKKINLNLREDAKVAIKNFNIKLFSGSITKDNFNNYFTFNDEDKYEFEIKNINTSSEDNNKLEFNAEVIDKQNKEKGTISRSFTFENDIKDIISEESKKEELEHYIDIKNTTKNLYSASEFFDNKNYENLIKPLYKRYFTFRIKNVVSSTRDKATLILEMLLNNKVVKEITVTSSNWNGKEFLNLPHEEKNKYILDNHISRYNEILYLKDYKKKVPVNYSPKNVNLNEIFNVEQVDGYKIELEKNEQSVNINDGRLKYKFKITDLKTNEVTYSEEHELGGFQKINDPTNYSDFNDQYFTTEKADQKGNDYKNLEDFSKKINGYNFKLRKTGDFSYLDPTYMNEKNLRYFLDFTGPEKVEKEVSNNIKPYNYDEKYKLMELKLIMFLYQN